MLCRSGCVTLRTRMLSASWSGSRSVRMCHARYFRSFYDAYVPHKTAGGDATARGGSEPFVLTVRVIRAFQVPRILNEPVRLVSQLGQQLRREQTRHQNKAGVVVGSTEGGLRSAARHDELAFANGRKSGVSRKKWSSQGRHRKNKVSSVGLCCDLYLFLLAGSRPACACC